MNREMILKHATPYEEYLQDVLADPIEAQEYLETAFAAYREDDDLDVLRLVMQDVAEAQGESFLKFLIPTYTEHLDLVNRTLPVLSDPEEIAQSRKQEILHLTLYLAGDIKTAAPIDFVGNIFIRLQKLINTIRMACLNSNSVTEAIKSEMQMSLLQIGEGSFDIRLASTQTVDLFGDSDSGDTIEEFLKLLNTGGDQDKLRAQLKRLKSRVAADYASFLKSLNESVIGTKITWTSPNPRKRATAELSNTEMREAIEILERFEEEPSTHPIIGTLIGISFKTKRFDIETTEQIYSGTIAEEAIEEVKDVRMNQTYTAIIREVTKKSEMTDEITKPEYYLISLKENVR